MDLNWLIVALVATFVLRAVTGLVVEHDILCDQIINSTCPDSKYIKFYLHTRSHPDSVLLDVASGNISKTSFNAKDPTKVVIHGFVDNEDGLFNFFVTLREAYFSIGEFNIIMVDWSRLAGKLWQPCYLTAENNIKHVGECTGQLIQLLRQNGVEDIHVIGHSLGAQTTNYVAKHVDPILPRITGLDPALPGFESITTLGIQLLEVTDADRLDKTDATFVDVIHTNINRFGVASTAGHVDFYLNDGQHQPGCLRGIYCSHVRAVLVFAESINTQVGFYGNQCTDLKEFTSGKCSTAQPRSVLMGEHVSKTSSGIIAVPTSDGEGLLPLRHSPFALGP